MINLFKVILPLLLTTILIPPSTPAALPQPYENFTDHRDYQHCLLDYLNNIGIISYSNDHDDSNYPSCDLIHSDLNITMTTMYKVLKMNLEESLDSPSETECLVEVFKHTKFLEYNVIATTAMQLEANYDHLEHVLSTSKGIFAYATVRCLVSPKMLAEIFTDFSIKMTLTSAEFECIWSDVVARNLLEKVFIADFDEYFREKFHETMGKFVKVNDEVTARVFLIDNESKFENVYEASDEIEDITNFKVSELKKIEENSKEIEGEVGEVHEVVTEKELIDFTTEFIADEVQTNSEMILDYPALVSQIEIMHTPKPKEEVYVTPIENSKTYKRHSNEILSREDDEKTSLSNEEIYSKNKKRNVTKDGFSNEELIKINSEEVEDKMEDVQSGDYENKVNELNDEKQLRNSQDQTTEKGMNENQFEDLQDTNTEALVDEITEELITEDPQNKIHEELINETPSENPQNKINKQIIQESSQNKITEKSINEHDAQNKTKEDLDNKMDTQDEIATTIKPLSEIIPIKLKNVFKSIKEAKTIKTELMQTTEETLIESTTEFIKIIDAISKNALEELQKLIDDGENNLTTEFYDFSTAKLESLSETTMKNSLDEISLELNETTQNLEAQSFIEVQTTTKPQITDEEKILTSEKSFTNFESNLNEEGTTLAYGSTLPMTNENPEPKFEIQSNSISRENSKEESSNLMPSTTIRNEALESSAEVQEIKIKNDSLEVEAENEANIKEISNNFTESATSSSNIQEHEENSATRLLLQSKMSDLIKNLAQPQPDKNLPISDSNIKKRDLSQESPNCPSILASITSRIKHYKLESLSNDDNECMSEKVSQKDIDDILSFVVMKQLAKTDEQKDLRNRKLMDLILSLVIKYVDCTDLYGLVDMVTSGSGER